VIKQLLTRHQRRAGTVRGRSVLLPPAYVEPALMYLRADGWTVRQTHGDTWEAQRVAPDNQPQMWRLMTMPVLVPAERG
jgi:hypothetical protein